MGELIAKTNPEPKTETAVKPRFQGIHTATLDPKVLERRRIELEIPERSWVWHDNHRQQYALTLKDDKGIYVNIEERTVNVAFLNNFRSTKGSWSIDTILKMSLDEKAYYNLDG